MPQQSGKYRVTYHCDRCAQEWGRGPVLAVAERKPWMVEGHWRFRVARRVPTRLHPEIGPFSMKSHSGGAVPDQPKSGVVKRGRFALVSLSAFEASAAQLICQKCKARPRVAMAKLVELAEQAMAAGRRDAYV